MTDSLKKILSSNNPKEIEEIAKTLSLDDINLVLQHIEKGEFQTGTLPFIQGLSITYFALFSQYSEEEKILAECINELPLFPIPSNIFDSICEQIVQLSEKTEVAIHLLDQILKLTWLSERSELVEIFSNLKNHFLILKQHESTRPAMLLNRVNSIFGSDNTASSIDGLPALGINYVEDLKQLSAVLGDDLANLPSNSLLPAIHDRLNGAGLTTISDLQAHQIYTKEHLFAFLKNTN